MTEQGNQKKINVADKDYLISDLSADAKAQLQGVQAADAEIKRLNIQLALAQTARNAYLQSLTALLPSDD